MTISPYLLSVLFVTLLLIILWMAYQIKELRKESYRYKIKQLEKRHAAQTARFNAQKKEWERVKQQSQKLGLLQQAWDGKLQTPDEKPTVKTYLFRLTSTGEEITRREYDSDETIPNYAIGDTIEIDDFQSDYDAAGQYIGVNCHTRSYRITECSIDTAVDIFTGKVLRELHVVHLSKLGE